MSYLTSIVRLRISLITERKCVAGIQRELPGMEDVDWGFFGTCSGNGKFTKLSLITIQNLLRLLMLYP